MILKDRKFVLGKRLGTYNEWIPKICETYGITIPENETREDTDN